MPSYLFLYRGPQADPSAASPDEQKAVMDAWNAYFGKYGKSIKDPGNPTMPGYNAKPGGKAGMATDVTGYSVVEAKDMAAAKAMMKDHPHLLDGKNSVDIFEVMPLM